MVFYNGNNRPMTFNEKAWYTKTDQYVLEIFLNLSDTGNMISYYILEKTNYEVLFSVKCVSKSDRRLLVPR